MSGFSRKKRLRSILLPTGWMLIHRRVTPALNLLIPIYTPGSERGTVRVNVFHKNTTQCLQLGLEPGQLDLETSALLIMRSSCFPLKKMMERGCDIDRRFFSVTSHALITWKKLAKTYKLLYGLRISERDRYSLRTSSSNEGTYGN